MENDTPRRMPNVPPFVKFVCANVPMVFDDSLSYYEALCALWKYIQGMTDVINNNATLEEEYIEKFKELKEFVDNYFANLDVQEEINNKLDAMVEDGTLAQIIGDYLEESVEYIAQGFIPNNRSMDCNIIKYHQLNQDKAIMVDCGTYDAWYYIYEMLQDNGITHLDYFILTHYHTDHDGNLQNLINMHFIDEDTVILVSAEYDFGNAGYQARMIADLAIFTNAGLTYRTPTEGEVINIDNLKLTFHNTDTTVLATYPTNPNNGSIVFLAEFNNTKALYAGDALDPVYRYLDSINFPSSNVDLFKIGHHGIQQYTDEKYIKRLSPTYAIQASGITDFEKNNFGICEEVSIMKALGTKIYASHMQPTYIKLKASDNNITCIDGIPVGFSDQLIERTFYVDANAGDTEIQDGTQAHPFKELMQAISIVEKTNGQNIIINVAAGNYGYSHESEPRKNRIYVNTGLSNLIEINGTAGSEPWLNGVIVRNANVYLKNVKIDTDASHNTAGLQVYNGNASLDGVTVKSKTNTASTKTGLSLTNHSNVDVRSDLYIGDVEDAISIQSGSIFTASDTVTIGTITGEAVTKATSGLAYFNDYLTFEDTTLNDSFRHGGYNSYCPVSLAKDHTAYSTTVELKQSASVFDWLEIFVRTNDNRYQSTGRIYSPNNKNVSLCIPNTNSGVTSIYNKQCNIYINGTTLTISRSLQIGINISTNALTVTTDSNNEYFDIVKVVGGFKDYIG